MLETKAKKLEFYKFEVINFLGEKSSKMKTILLISQYTKLLKLLTLFRRGFFEAAHGWGGG